MPQAFFMSCETQRYCHDKERCIKRKKKCVGVLLWHRAQSRHLGPLKLGVWHPCLPRK